MQKNVLIHSPKSSAVLPTSVDGITSGNMLVAISKTLGSSVIVFSLAVHEEGVVPAGDCTPESIVSGNSTHSWESSTIAVGRDVVGGSLYAERSVDNTSSSEFPRKTAACVVGDFGLCEGGSPLRSRSKGFGRVIEKEALSILMDSGGGVEGVIKMGSPSAGWICDDQP